MRWRPLMIALWLLGCGHEQTGSEAGESSTSSTDATTGDGDGAPGDGDGDGVDCAIEPSQTTIATSYGPVTGVALDGVVRFANIPYAAPPVGPLRFALPQPPTCSPRRPAMARICR